MRNQGLDTLRIIAAFSVITLHFEPYDSIPRDIIEKIWLNARYAVPVFFIASGFLLQPKLAEAPESVLKNLSRILVIFAYSCVFYVPWALIRGAEWSDLLTLNILTVGTAYHLWFLPSLGFGILILIEFYKSRRSAIFILIATIVLSAYIVGNYLSATPGSVLSLLRFVSSIPFLALGVKIGELRLRSKGIAGLQYERPIGVFLVLAGSILQTFEFSLASSQIHGTPHFQLGIGTCCVAVGLFITAISFPQFQSKTLAAISMLGARYSTGIYIWHVWWVSLTKQIYSHFGILDLAWSSLLMPFIVFLATLCMLACWRRILSVKNRILIG